MKSVLNNRKKASVNADQVDLDVTPIMNMFVILIPFLVSMAVFTHYSVLEFSLPPSAGMGVGGPEKKDLKLTVVVQTNQFELTVGDSLISSIDYKPLDADLTSLEESLITVRKNLTRKNEVVVAVNDGIEFDTVVKVMDSCKKTGFQKVALAEGPNRTPGKSAKNRG